VNGSAANGGGTSSYDSDGNFTISTRTDYSESQSSSASGLASSTLVRTLTATHALDGSYSVDAAPALPLGGYTARAEQADGSGNLGVSTVNGFTIIGGPPPPPPPPPGPPDPVLVGAGDIAGCGSSPQDEATAAVIDGLPDAKAFTLGDNAYPDGSTADYACYNASWGRFKARTIPVVGGHDYTTPGAAAYFSYFGAAAGDPNKGYYSFDLGSWHVVVLNANCNDVAGGCGTGSPQEQWLRADLAAHPVDCHARVLLCPEAAVGIHLRGHSADEEGRQRADDDAEDRHHRRQLDERVAAFPGRPPEPAE